MIRVYRSRNLLHISEKLMKNRRMKITFRSGAIKPMPQITSFGVFGVFLAVIPGTFLDFDCLCNDKNIFYFSRIIDWRSYKQKYRRIFRRK